MFPPLPWTNRKAIVYGSCSILLALLTFSTYKVVTRQPRVVNEILHPLPLDAESLVHDFRFSRSFKDGTLTITGKRLVRRGRKFFMVRSMVIKSNIIDDIDGTYRDKKNAVEFSAEKAEWEFTPKQPLDLKGVRRLVVNGAEVRNAPEAVIWISAGKVKVYGNAPRTYLLKQ